MTFPRRVARLFAASFLFSSVHPVIASGHPPGAHGTESWGLERSHTSSLVSSSQSTGEADCGYPGGSPTATIDIGVVIGTQTTLPTATAPVNKFLGVPFASSPPERFSPPTPPDSLSSALNATAFKPACVQQFVYPPATQEFTEIVFNDPGGPTPVESEDCLYLNVFAPSTPAPADGRSVLFWIYGGSLEFGNAGQPGYDGSFFAGYEDVIVVTTNYRTNVFGFASTPELPLAERNLGFLDQRMALDWVQRNIAAFGGSPDKVTIFGESAGAFSVDAILTSYNATSTLPFRGAILESGQYSFNVEPLTSTFEQWYNLSAQLGCPGAYGSNLTCLRAANATAIKLTIEESILVFNPTKDNVTLYSDTATRRLTGQVAHVPAICGTNAQEGRVFEFGTTNTTAGLIAVFGDIPSLISEFEDMFALNSPGIGDSEYDQISQIFTEYVFQCPQAIWANATAATGIPTWRYYFNASFYNQQPFPGLGVYHSSEIPLVYGTYYKDNATTQQVALSASMMGAWARFAKNPAGGPGWNPIGTGAVANVLVGATANALGGIYTNLSSDVQPGVWNLGVFGNVGTSQSSGVTVVDQSEVDFRCSVFFDLYEAINGVSVT